MQDSNIDPIYYRNLPRKYMGAAALFMNKNKEILLVKPKHKQDWQIPGGVVDQNESPQHACEREIKEELGISIKPDRLLVMDFSTQDGVRGDSLQFIFLGGLLSEKLINEIKLQAEELEACKFVTIEQALKLVSIQMSKRLTKAFDALDNYTTLVLEDGEYT